MSRIKPQWPIVHTPSFPKFEISRFHLESKVRALGAEPLYPYGVFADYTYTNRDGLVPLLPDLIISSDLYGRRFVCINYAFRVWNVVCERYELNTFFVGIGRVASMPAVRHAFNVIYTGEDFLLFEPNEGFEWSGQAFEIGDNGYTLELLFY